MWVAVRKNRSRDRVVRDPAAFQAEVGQVVVGDVHEGPRLSIFVQRSVNATAATCQNWPSASRTIDRLQWWLTLQSAALLLMALGACGWLALHTPAVATAVPAPTVPAVLGQCHLDGKTYSIGSTAKMASGALRECIQDAGDGAPYWGGAVQKASIS